MPEILVVVATALEAERLPRCQASRVVVSGVGAVNAALATQAALLESRARLVLSVGIAGAYPWGGAAVGEVVVSSQMIYAGLGAEDGQEFLDLERLGFPLIAAEGAVVHNALPAATECAAFARDTGAKTGPILTLETITGSPRGLERLRRLYPTAIAEGMEGAGVAHAALLQGVAALEIRGISNAVEAVRNRSSWQIGAALEALKKALETGWDALQP